MTEFVTSVLGSWVRPFIPTPGVILLVGLIGVLYATFAAWLAGYLKQRAQWRTAYTRKVFHFLIFTVAGIIQLVWGLGGVVVYGGLVSLRVLYAVARGDGNDFYEALARPSDAPHRTLYIIIPLITTAVGGVLSNLFFAPFGHVGYLVCGWGDAVGEPVGARWGAHRYRVLSLTGTPATRSLEGSGAVFLTGSVAAALALAFGGLPLGTAALVGLACGFGGAIVEAFSNHGLDNLTTQLAGAAVAYLLLV